MLVSTLNATAPSRDGENLGHEHCSWLGALDEFASCTARDAVVEGIRPDAAVDAVDAHVAPHAVVARHLDDDGELLERQLLVDVASSRLRLEGTPLVTIVC